MTIVAISNATITILSRRPPSQMMKFSENGRFLFEAVGGFIPLVRRTGTYSVTKDGLVHTEQRSDTEHLTTEFSLYKDSENHYFLKYESLIRDGKSRGVGFEYYPVMIKHE